MAWNFVPQPRARAAAPLSVPDGPAFPAGVVGLGRGGAGEIGALLREDGVYIGLLSLGGAAGREGHDLESLARALPPGDCQLVTMRWPVDAERAAAAWRATARERGGQSPLAATVAGGYIPSLVAAGWADLRSFLAIRRPDIASLLRDLAATAEALPVLARPATLLEAKRLAGDWFAPHDEGLVTIGWSLAELTAEPPPEWARLLLEDEAVRGLPVAISLHLDAVGSPAPVSLAVHRRVMALDAAIEELQEQLYQEGEADEAALDALLAERGELVAAMATGTAEGRPRGARLLIGCAVEPGEARARRGEIEAALTRVGFRAISFGPGRSDDTLLSCAPLGLALIGQDLTLTAHGAALLAPLTGAAMPGGAPTSELPLGLRRDGAPLLLAAGEDLAIVGDAAGGAPAMAQSWALAQLAAGGCVTVVDTTGRWSPVALAAAGERVQVALGIGGLLATLGAERLHRDGGDAAAVAGWVDLAARLLGDLCPDLCEDELGDLTAYLMTLAEGELAWGEPVQLAPVVARLRESDNEAVRHLAAMLAATGALRPRPQAAGGGALTIFDAAPDHGGQRLVPPAGCAAVALQAALDGLTARPGGTGRQIVILDDFATLLESAAGPALVADLIAQIRYSGAALWIVAESLAACPAVGLAPLRALDPAVAIFPGRPEGARATARALGLRPGLFDGRVLPAAGEALVVRGEEVTMVGTVPLALPPYAQRR